LESLKRLQTDYLDVYILHDVEFGNEKQICEESVPTLLELKKQGLIKNIGISGYPLDKLYSIAKQCNHETPVIDLVLSYCNYTLQNDLLREYSKKFQDLGVSIINASPLSMRLLTKIGPPEWHPCSKEIKECMTKVNAYCEEKDLNVSKIAIQYSINTNDFSKTTLIGFSSVEEVEEAIRWIEEESNEEALKDIQEIMKNVHNQTW
jgi:L-galactose dehydrogenase